MWSAMVQTKTSTTRSRFKGAMATSDPDGKISRQRLWQKKAKATGRCVRCGQELGDSSIVHCDKHREWHRLWQRERRLKKKKDGMI